MASSSKKITYEISCNTKLSQSAVQALEKRLQEVVAAMTELEQKGKGTTQQYKVLRAESEGLNKALKDNRDALQKLQENVNNLSGLTMRKLKETLSGIKREYDKLKNVGTDPEATKNAEWLKQKYEEVNAELKKRGIEYVNIEKVMNRISKVSDDTLSRGIKQQEALLHSLERESSEYVKQEGILKRLYAEQDKRAGKEPIDMRDVMNRLSVVSNDTLDKAIKNQDAYVNGLERETDQYNAQAVILEKLNAEKDRRNGKGIAAEGPSLAQMESVASNPMNFSENEIEAAKKYFETMRKDLKVGSAEWKKYDSYVNQCKESLNELFRVPEKEDNFDLAKTLGNLSTAPIDDLKRAESELEKKINAVNRDTEEYVRLSADLKRVKGEIEGVNDQWKKHDSALKGVFKRLAAYVGIYGAFNFLKNQIMGVVKENIAFSDSLADIRKSTGLTTKEVGELSDAINKIDTRTSRQELHDLAYEAGRMGLGKYGVAGIEQFVKAADKLKVALGEDLGDDAILQLTKMTDVMGLIPKYGVEQSLLKVGSAINELAQNSTAKGTYITDYASRLSGVSLQCNLATSELFGLAAANDSLSLETEVAATAMSKFLVQLSQYDKQDAIAKAAGMEVEALRELVDSGRMGDAVLKVLEGLGKRGGMGQLAPIMKDLGSDGSRMVNIFSTLASNVDKVRSNMVLASIAFDENTSVVNEFNIKNSTAAAIMERTANSWKALMVNFKNSSIAKDIALTIKRLSDELQRNGILLVTLRTTLYVIVEALKMVVHLLPALTMFGIGKAVALLVVGLAKLNASMTGTVGKLGEFAIKLGLVKREIIETTATTKQLSNEMKAASMTNTLLAIASILTAVAIPAFQRLTGYVRDLKSKFSDVSRGVVEMNAEVEQSTKKVNQAFDKLDELQKQGQKDSVEYLKIEKKLNDEHGALLKGLVTEEGRIQNLSAARDVLNKKLEQSIAYRMREKLIMDANTEGTKEQIDALTVLQDKLSKKGMSQEQIDNVTTFLRTNAGSLGEQSGIQKFFGLDSGTGEAVRDVIKKNGGKVNDKLFETALPAVDLLMKLFNSKTGDQQLMEAVENYAHSVATVERRLKVIDDEFLKKIGDYKPDIEEELFGGGGTEGDGDGGKGGGETKISKVKRQYEAFISLIEAYYNRKRALAREDFNQGKMTETQLTQQEEDINKQRLETLMAARRSMMDFDEGNAEWTKVTEEMRQLSRIEDDELYMIAEQLARQDIKTFGATIRSFGAEMTDGIINGIESNEAELQNIEVNIQKALAQALLERDLTGKVRQEYGGSMQRLGLLSYLIPDGKTAKEAMNDVLEQMLSVYDSGALFEITEKDAGKAMKEILASFTGISDEMRNMDDTRLRLLLDYMIRFGNATDDARKKLETMRHNTLLQNWDRSAQGQSLAQRARNDEREGTFIGQLAGLVGGNNVVQSQGVRSAANEVDAIAQKIAMLRAQGDAEAELIKLTDELEAAENKLTQALIENVKDQSDVIRELGGVLETAADEWGEYLGTTYETEEDSANARIEIWNSMVDSVGGAIEKILQQWVTETITTAMLNQAKLEQQRQANIQMEAEQARHTAAMISTEATELTAVGAAETGKASAKAIGTYGLKGVAIAALASAIIGGFISFAMAKLKKSSVKTNNSNTAANDANRRIVSGMLTYDKGNVQALGSDGHLYSATPVGALQTGLYTSPVATTVNGQPALVAEKGPELVIGRETTAYIRRNDPALLRALVTVDKHYSGRYRTFDSGNVSALSPALSGGYSEADLVAVIARLNAILDGGVKTNITMLGPNGLLKEIDHARNFEKRHS